MTVSVKLLEHTSEVSLLPCSSSASAAVASFTIGFDSLAISINALVRSLEPVSSLVTPENKKLNCCCEIKEFKFRYVSNALPILYTVEQ